MSKYFDKVTKKLKSIKNKEFIIAILICVVVLIVFFAGNFGSFFTVTNNSSEDSQYTFAQYSMLLEEKLNKLIADIKDVTNASVAISYEAGVEKVYAYATEIVTSGGVTTETNELITIGGQPLVIKELAPSIKGVVVVINGTDSPVVRMHATEIVVTLLDIDSSKVQVFAYQ